MLIRLQTMLSNNIADVLTPLASEIPVRGTPLLVGRYGSCYMLPVLYKLAFFLTTAAREDAVYKGATGICRETRFMVNFTKTKPSKAPT